MLLRRSTFAAAAPLLVAAFLTSGGPGGHSQTARTFSDAASTHAAAAKTRPDDHSKECPFYGCPLHPVDVHYNTEALKGILQTLRDLPAEKVDEKVLQGDPQTEGWNRRDAASLTLIGYKGGPLLQQVNQDRALVVSPFLAAEEAAKEQPSEANNQENKDPNQQQTVIATKPWIDSNRILLGVFDGHANRGELVSEFTVQQLPATLAQKLARLPPPPNPEDADDKDADEERQVGTIRALHETFVEMDQLAPADPSGGCTATVILLQDEKLYIANAGDSRSFIVAYRPSTKMVQIVYISREDKPSLPDERSRVEAMGGQVYIPMRGTSRVVYHDPITGAPSGLAMSRSIGDWAAGKLGVIPDPIVDVLEIPNVVRSVLNNGTKECYFVDENGDVDTGACNDRLREDGEDAIEDDVYLFGVAATDGMMDYLGADDIARVLASALFDEGANHPVTACELLIFSAANGWQQDKQGRYRDDIAIAVSALRRPPQTSQHEDPADNDTK